jgi:4-hydroxy-3-methylbut-2-en-1-yl diphosphate reductase
MGDDHPRGLELSKFAMRISRCIDYLHLQMGDVVVLPVFGASVHKMRLPADRGVHTVDTCPCIAKVWTAVDEQMSLRAWRPGLCFIIASLLGLP